MSDLARLAQRAARNSYNSLPSPSPKRSYSSIPAHNHKFIARVPRPRIGQLLLEAGIVKPNSLHHALDLAKESKQPVGRILVGLGYLAERDLQSALLVQGLIGEGAVTEQAAIRAIREAATRRADVVDILKEIDDHNTVVHDDGGLGSLLVAAGLLTPEVLEDAIEKSHVSGLLLGRTLLLTNGVTAPMLQTTLTLLVMQRDGQITKEQAIKLLREVRRSLCCLEEAFTVCRIKPSTPAANPRLGELLALSKFITEGECAVAVERALQEKRLVGEILVKSGMVRGTVLSDALALQIMVSRGALSVAQAADLLQRSSNERKSIAQVAAETGAFNYQSALGDRAMSLIKRSSIVPENDCLRAVAEHEAFQMSECKAVLASGRLSPTTYAAAVHCIDMIDRGKLKDEQAVAALLVCDRSQCDLGTALAQLGLAPNQPMPVVEAVSTGNNLHTTILDWFSYAEFRQVLALVVFIMSSNFAMYMFAPAFWQIGVWISMVAMGAGMMKLGFSWRRSREQREAARDLHLTSAQQTKSRLEKLAR